MESSKTLNLSQSPIISIITPCYNGANYIERSIRNVLEQRFFPLEHIIIDNASTDGTVEILNRFPHLRWISEPDRGQADALNKGFRMARGEIIGWLNGDDSYVPGAIRVGVDYLLSHPECDIVYGDCNILRNDGTLLTVFHSKQVKGWEQLLGGWIHTPAVFFRRRILDRVGYLDESLHYVMDNEFWLRAAPLVRQDYIPRVLANFHHQIGSKSLTKIADFSLEMCRIYENAFSREPYISQIPCEVRRQMLARYFWYCGINLVLTKKSDDAGLYLRKAIDEYGVLNYPHIVTECLITRYIQRDVRTWLDVVDLVNILPLEETVRDQLMIWCRRTYPELSFFAAYNRRDWSEVKRSGLKAVINRPANLRSRGFLSIWAESMLGTRFTEFVRKLI
jgi:glycosyltransferase involved in cell wall biosynthesis